MYEWALGHHEPHFGGVAGARELYFELVGRFDADIGRPINERVVARLGQVT